MLAGRVFGLGVSGACGLCGHVHKPPHDTFHFPDQLAPVVRQIHAKAMPVVLTMPEEFDAWLSAEPHEALTLQRPLPADQLKIVAKGERKDQAAA